MPSHLKDHQKEFVKVDDQGQPTGFTKEAAKELLVKMGFFEEVS